MDRVLSFLIRWAALASPSTGGEEQPCGSLEELACRASSLCRALEELG